jgi:hypothetical protein
MTVSEHIDAADERVLVRKWLSLVLIIAVQGSFAGMGYAAQTMANKQSGGHVHASEDQGQSPVYSSAVVAALTVVGVFVLPSCIRMLFTRDHAESTPKRPSKPTKTPGAPERSTRSARSKKKTDDLTHRTARTLFKDSDSDAGEE